MATKQATTTQVNFEDMSIDELEQWEKEQAEIQEQQRKVKLAKIQASKQEAFDSLLEVVKKYHLNGTDIINSLLANRKISFKEVQEVEPIYLINAKVQKKNRKTGVMEEGDFKFYEGKVILADAEQARFVCANGVDAFKANLTEKGKEYLANEDTKQIIVKFYNEYKPAQAQKWDGQ
ncbi:hypothetical protein [Enterobacter roggenkampii]|uniref:hypothetical protein n=1 Tax=Enterobacter roggenkampii TaxID=1812935 RepID=UPI00403F6368